MKCEGDGESNGEVHEKNSCDGMAVVALDFHAQKILEVRCHTSDDQSRSRDPPSRKAHEWQNDGRMGEGQGHSILRLKGKITVRREKRPAPARNFSESYAFFRDRVARFFFLERWV